MFENVHEQNGGKQTGCVIHMLKSKRRESEQLVGWGVGLFFSTNYKFEKFFEILIREKNADVILEFF